MLLVRCNFSPVLCRTYAKWLKRRAVRVLTSEESEQFHATGRNSPAAKPCLNAETVVSKPRSGVVQDNVTFETLHVGDPRFGPVLTHAKSVVGRERRRIILLEGRRLVSEAVETSQPIQSIFFTDADVLKEFPVKSLAESGVKFYKVKKDHMNLWSDTVAPQGIMAICRLQKRGSSRKVKDGNSLLPLTLICDNIKDPGILGTLIRSAVAAACRTVLITKGCVDVWEPKVLRSGAGAHFHSHSVVTEVTWQQVGNYLTEDTELLLANSSSPEVVNCSGSPTASRKGAKDKSVAIDLSQLSSVKFEMINCSVTADTALLVSSGLTADAYQFAASHNGNLISFPAVDRDDVMNAAVSGSVALFEIVRQLRLMATHTSDAAAETGVM